MPRAPSKSADIELDIGRYELRRAGRRVKLARKPMELLIFLLNRRDQLVSREDIVRKLWPSDLFVDTERNTNNIVRKIRRAIGDNAAKPRFLETVVGKGYRFVGPVKLVEARHAALGSGEISAQQPPTGPTPGQWSDRSSLAVLPLLLVGAADDDRGLCLGFADALISRLGNLAGVDVLPTASVLQVPLEKPSAQIASHLGVRFLLRGAMQTSRSQSRIALELFDTHRNRLLLAKKYALDFEHLAGLEDSIAKEIARALNRPLNPPFLETRTRYSKDPLAYAEFAQGLRLSSSGNPALIEEAATRLSNAVNRDPTFALAHATLSVVCATRHFESDPARTYLEQAEFHCRRALDLDPNLAEAHVANAFLLWGPSKNFQHLDAIAELRRAIALQQNLPHAYNRLGTVLAHIGLLDHARKMYERGSWFHPKKAVSHSIVQVYLWSYELDLAENQIQDWIGENSGNKYPHYFAPQLAMMKSEWKQAKSLLEKAQQLEPDEPLLISLQGVLFALTGKSEPALKCLAQACAIPKSFGHAHHTYYQIACILAILGRRGAAFEWLERSVSTGFACWPYFLKDRCLQNLHGHPDFDVLISGLQGKYPDHLGLI